MSVETDKAVVRSYFERAVNQGGPLFLRAHLTGRLPSQSGPG